MRVNRCNLCRCLDAGQQTVPMATGALWSLSAHWNYGTAGRLRNSCHIPVICIFLEELALCSVGGEENNSMRLRPARSLTGVQTNALMLSPWGHKGASSCLSEATRKLKCLYNRPFKLFYFFYGSTKNFWPQTKPPPSAPEFELWRTKCWRFWFQKEVNAHGPPK